MPLPLASFPQLINFEESLLIRLSSREKTGKYMRQELFGVDEVKDSISRCNTETPVWKSLTLRGSFCVFLSSVETQREGKRETLCEISPTSPEAPHCPVNFNRGRKFSPGSLGPPLPLARWTSSPSGQTSLYLSSHKQLLKKPKLPSGCGGATQASAPNHPLPRQHSSRQQLQQINLALTVHLDWINLELGAITAIGRRGYSPNAPLSCFGDKEKEPAFPFFSLLLQDRLDKVFFCADRRAEGGREPLDFHFN